MTSKYLLPLLSVGYPQTKIRYRPIILMVFGVRICNIVFVPSMNCAFLDPNYYFLNYCQHTHIFYPHHVDKVRPGLSFGFLRGCSQKSQTGLSDMVVPKISVCLHISIIISTKQPWVGRDYPRFENLNGHLWSVYIDFVIFYACAIVLQFCLFYKTSAIVCGYVYM